MTSKATKLTHTAEEIQAVLDDIGDDLPDGAFWMIAHERLDLEYGDLFPIMEELGMFNEVKDVPKA